MSVSPSTVRSTSRVNYPQFGFTLTELMVTVVVAGILAAIAVPNFNSLMRNSRLTTVTNTLIAHMSFARSEAIKRRQTVALCGTTNPSAPNPACGGIAGDWTAGWLVFVNVDGIAPATLGVGDILLKRSEGVSGSITVITNATSSTYLEFATDGTSNMPANGIARFAICDDRGTEFGRQINVSALGRPGLSKGQTGAGITSCTAPI